MIFLPIVGRELRVAAGRGSTYWLRVAAAGVALILGAGMVSLTLVSPFGRLQSGAMIFTSLSWLSLLAALSAGLVFTADCLSEEKREGTLGFLFLTDLRGYDVVLGKLLANSLRSVFPLLAIFPILALTQLLGGVAPGEFWRALLAIGSAAFFSLATGLFISSVSQQSLKALAGTLGLLVLFAGFGVVADEVMAQVYGRSQPRLSLASPVYVFTAADTGRTFWAALAVNQAVAWSLLGLACGLVRRTWQIKPEPLRGMNLLSRLANRQRVSERSRRRREQLLATTPVAWLVAREREQTFMAWVVALVLLVGLVLLVIFSYWTSNWLAGWAILGGLLPYVLYLWVAAKACQFSVEARRSGLLELLLATPLTSREMVLGAWRGLVRLFAGAVLVLVSVQTVGLFLNGTGMLRSMGRVSGLGWLTTTSGIAGLLVVVCNLMALAWFGMWMGLTSRNTLIATLKTIVFVQIVPWFVIHFLTFATIPLVAGVGGWTSGKRGASMAFTSLWLSVAFVLLPLVLTLVKAILFWTLAWRKLTRRFRELATQAVVPVRPANLPPKIPRRS